MNGENASVVSLSSDKIVQGLPLFGSRMPPGDLLPSRNLEDGIGYEKLVFSTYAEKTNLVVITVSLTPVSDYCSVIPQSGIQIAKDGQFISWCKGD